MQEWRVGDCGEDAGEKYDWWRAARRCSVRRQTSCQHHQVLRLPTEPWRYRHLPADAPAQVCIGLMHDVSVTVTRYESVKTQRMWMSEVIGVSSVCLFFCMYVCIMYAGRYNSKGSYITWFNTRDERSMHLMVFGPEGHGHRAWKWVIVGCAVWASV